VTGPECCATMCVRYTHGMEPLSLSLTPPLSPYLLLPSLYPPLSLFLSLPPFSPAPPSLVQALGWGREARKRWSHLFRVTKTWNSHLDKQKSSPLLWGSERLSVFKGEL
jgi:hypothetical protein